MNLRRLLVAGLIAMAQPALAACVADGPVATARWIRVNQPEFAIYLLDQDLKLKERILSPGLLALLKVEWQCEVIEEGFCALEADPWTNTEVGDVLDPLSFELAAATGIHATVNMRFRFGNSDQEKSKPVAARAALTLVRDAGTGCWQLEDLVGMGGQSLVMQLRAYGFYP